MSTREKRAARGLRARDMCVALRAVAQHQDVESNSPQRYAVIGSNAGAGTRVDGCSHIERTSTKEWHVSPSEHLAPEVAAHSRHLSLRAVLRGAPVLER